MIRYEWGNGQQTTRLPPRLLVSLVELASCELSLAIQGPELMNVGTLKA